MNNQPMPDDDLDLAIIGISGRFPGANNIDGFWQNLVDGVESIHVLSEDELRQAGVGEEALADPKYVRAASRLENVERFDAEFFGYSPREASSIDPQQRLLLECAWEALEDAGYPPSAAPGPVGVFTATSTSTYLMNNLHPGLDLEEFILSSRNLQTVIGNANDFGATRLSYKLNLTGPSLNIQTACSSSLVAVHMARQSLLSGECDLALAGGASIYLPQNQGYKFQDGLILSPDGHCRVFDAKAQGTIFGRGAGIVLLKPLAAALRDRDHIYAVIKGSAINNDGSVKAGFTAPSINGQAAAITEALANADLDADLIGYVEAHGTGTTQGDPIEIAGLTQAFRQTTQRTGYCAIGSVKSNFGHLDVASGVVGLIKTALILDRGLIPPTLHFTQPNPGIDFASSPFVVNAQLRSWPREQEPRRAGVSSFGMGGTNAHMILEEAAESNPVAAETERPMHLLALSAKDENALSALAGLYARHLKDHPEQDLADVCFTANTGRVHFAHRLADAGKTHDELRDRLEKAGSGIVRGEPARVAFLFTGQGSQYAGMGRELYQTQPTFRKTMDRCAELLRPELDRPLLKVMFETGDALNQTIYTQPALFALEYSLSELWKSWGVEPSAVLGHSVGEYVAACVAGVFSLEDGLKLIAARGRLMQGLGAGGAMAAVFAGEREVRQEIAGTGLSIAALNGPANTVISGAETGVETALERFAKGGIQGTRLAVSHAFHSALMEPMLEEFEHAAAQVSYRRPKLALISNLTGRMAEGEEVCGRRYWRRQVREAVRFEEGIRALVEQGFGTMMEIGPQPVLIGMGRQCVAQDAVNWVSTLRRGREDWAELIGTVSRLYVQGVRIDWEGFDRDYPRRRLRLPTYPFQRQRYWIDAPHPSAPATIVPVAQSGHPLLGRRLRSPKLNEIVYEVSVGAQAPAYLGGHRVFDLTVFPATGYLEAVRASMAALAEGDCVIRNLEIVEAFILPETGERTLQLILSNGSPGEYEFGFYSLEETNQHDAIWRLHATGSAGVSGTAPIPRTLPEPAAAEWIPGETFYNELRSRGLQYGDSFRRIARIRTTGGASEVDILSEPGSALYFLHPALFDSGLQHVLACLPHDPSASDGTYMPVAFENVRFQGAGRNLRKARAQVRRDSSTSFSADVQLLDDSGNVIVEIGGLKLRPVSRTALSRKEEPDRLDRFLYRPVWRPSVAPDALHADISTAALAENAMRRCGNLSETLGIYDHLGPELDRLCLAYAAAAIQQLGWDLAPGTRRRASGLAEELKIVTAHRRMFGRLIEMLEEEGVLGRDGEFWIVQRAPGHIDPALFASDLSQKWPSCDAEISMTARCGSELARVLTGVRDPLELLFPGGSLRDLEAIYHDAPFTRAYNGLVEAVVAGLAASVPGRLRILEIGAGTGGTTRALLPGLAPQRTEYTYTDVSPLFLARAEDRFGEYPFVRYRRLDIDEEPENQGFHGEKFDVVIASNVLHATRDLRKTIERVHRLTAPGGLIVMVEGIQRQRWVDLIFGLTEGWWKFTDSELRPSYPLLSLAQWQALLPAAGFADVRALPPAESGANIFGQAVILARAAENGGTKRCRWIVFADRGDLANQLSAQLQSRGRECVVIRPANRFEKTGDAQYTVNPAQEEDYRLLIESELRETDSILEGIAHLWSIDGVTSVRESTSGQHVDEAQLKGCRSVLELVKALVGARLPHPPHLCLVTQGVQSGETTSAAAHATIWGLGRVIALEHPELKCTRIDLDSADAEQLCRELLSPTEEREIAYRSGERCALRLEPVKQESVRSAERRLALAQPGELGSLAFESCERRSPGPHEVEIEVCASGLNFRDVLVALGMYPDSTVTALGSECAGIVSASGSEVEGFRIGDAVVAMAPNSFATHVIAPAAMTVLKPERLSFEEAASVPGAFLTASYALCSLAQLKASESVLIHSAAGGVGLAAVQIALKLGAEVFATAGNREKRDYLSTLGVRHVLDSRSVNFLDSILEATAGRGVDVVLNSLSGDAVECSIRALAAGGRFVELGKRDIWSHSQFSEARPKAQYFIVDVAAECERQPQKMGKLLRGLIGEFEAGVLVPAPRRVFGWQDAAKAFRLMSRAEHIGKIVIAQSFRKGPGARLKLRSEGTYLITGGLGGLGLLTAKWMVDRGARHIVLMGRHGATARAQEEIARLRGTGATIVAVQGDVSLERDVAKVLEKIARELPPLRGVLHAAGVLDDGVLHRQTWPRFQTVMAAKVYGAVHLHRLTRNTPLDFFVLFSSAASLLGSPGQANHAAANAFLDSMAHFRRSIGLPALSINWGPWAEIGAAAERKGAGRIPIHGMSAISPEEGLLLLERLIESGESQVGAFAMNWRSYAAGVAGSGQETPEWVRELEREQSRELRAQPAPEKSSSPRGETSDFADRIQQAPPSRKRPLVADFVEAQVVKALGLNPSQSLDRRRPFQELGLDSLLAVELRNILSNALGLPRRLSATLLFDYPSVEAVTDFLAGELSIPEDGLPAKAQGKVEIEEIESLSDAEAEKLLLEELNED